MQRESDGESEGETPEQHRDRGRDAGAETSCARARPAAALFTSFRAAVPQHRPYGLGNALRRALAPWLLCPLSPRVTKVFSRVVPLGRRGAATSATERVWGVRPISVSVQCMDMHRTACCLYATICVSRIWNGRAQGTAVWAARHVCASISTTRCAPAKRAVRAPRCPGQLGPDWCGRHSGGRLFTGGAEEGEAREGASVSGAQALFRGLNAQY